VKDAYKLHMSCLRTLSFNKTCVSLSLLLVTKLRKENYLTNLKNTLLHYFNDCLTISSTCLYSSLA